MSVNALMEKAVKFFVEHKEKELLNTLTEQQKEDLGLLLLIQRADRTKTVSEDEIMKAQVL